MRSGEVFGVACGWIGVGGGKRRLLEESAPFRGFCGIGMFRVNQMRLHISTEGVFSPSARVGTGVWLEIASEAKKKGV